MAAWKWRLLYTYTGDRPFSDVKPIERLSLPLYSSTSTRIIIFFEPHKITLLYPIPQGRLFRPLTRPEILNTTFNCTCCACFCSKEELGEGPRGGGGVKGRLWRE